MTIDNEIEFWRQMQFAATELAFENVFTGVLFDEFIGNAKEAMRRANELIAQQNRNEDQESFERENEQQNSGVDIMTTECFWMYVDLGCFNEDDGIGYYGDKKTASSYCVWAIGPDSNYTHVHWFNK